MALPRKLKYPEYVHRRPSYMGVVESVMLPKLTASFENHRGGGMNGAAAITRPDDDALTVEWSVGGLPDVASRAQYAAPGADAVPRFAGLVTSVTTPLYRMAEVVMRLS